ncbi:MAG: beta-propeller domain-containing protein [Promethearchaeota archaeon]
MSVLTKVRNRLRVFTHRATPSIRVLLFLVAILGSSAFLGVYFGLENSPPVQLQRFSSSTALINFLETHHPPPMTGFWDEPLILSQIESTPRSDYNFAGTSGYSTTNVQTEGVDEPDSVKTDGKYIYTIVEEEIVIVDSYPPETAKISSRIQLIGSPIALFLYTSSKIVVIEQNDGELILEIFDISTPEEITLDFWLKLDGYYHGARMIGQYVFLIAHSYVQDNRDITLPFVETSNSYYSVPVKNIYYDPGDYDHGFHYKMIVCFDITDSEADPDIETILMGGSTCTVYSSLNNIYLAVSRYPLLTRSTFDKTTSIHRFQIDAGDVSYKASGIIPGYLINQFALDEAQAYLRVATTSWFNTLFKPELDTRPWIEVSNIYILDMNMKITGKVEGLAPGERIYSARFVGTTAYLVTFYKTDPLFIIDLTLPQHPKLLGELVIPGYSEYLHPLDNGFLLGLGKDVIASETEQWWYQGVKVSLFNITNPFQPEETKRLIIGDRGTESEALYDHKAVLVDTDRNLLVIPICLAVHPEGSNPEPYDHGEIIWQGAYIFKFNTTDGQIEHRGGITHLEDLEAFREDWWNFRDFFIKRTLYIGDVLYTISQQTLMYHSLSDLNYIGEIVLTSGSG